MNKNNNHEIWTTCTDCGAEYDLRQGHHCNFTGINFYDKLTKLQFAAIHIAASIAATEQAQKVLPEAIAMDAVEIAKSVLELAHY